MWGHQLKWEIRVGKAEDSPPAQERNLLEASKRKLLHSQIHKDHHKTINPVSIIPDPIFSIG